MQLGGGGELQGIKRGILELAIARILHEERNESMVPVGELASRLGVFSPGIFLLDAK